jgi:SAM-dependent methyltransferase
VEVAGIRAGARVLDIASGRGAVLFPAADRVGAGGEVVGIDLADAMASATSEEAATRGLNARVSVMDAEELSFPDASFDYVTCGFGIMFFPDQVRSLAEMRRVLKPGGRLAISTWQVSQSDGLYPVLKELGLPVGHSPGWITEPSVLEALIARNGFAGVRVTVDSKEFRYAGAEEFWQQGRGTGMRRTLDTVNPEQKKQAISLLTERMRPHQRADGYYVGTTALLAVANS